MIYLCYQRPAAKGKQIFPPCLYIGKTTHALEKCWKEFGKPEWAQAMFSSITPSPTPPSISMPTVRPTIQITFTPAKYEAWKQSQGSTSIANLASTSGTHAFLTSRSSWVIDSGASAHLIGTPSTLFSLTPTTASPPVSIADGHSCSVKGFRLTKPTLSLTLDNVIYVPSFPTNLLSISTITRTLNCVVIFYPFHCVFHDGYYVAYKPITLSCILFMFIEMKFIHCHSCVMFAMKSMSMCNDYVNYDEIII